MGSVFFILTLLALFIRGDLRLLAARRRGRRAVMTEVSFGQRVLARQLFFLARIQGGLRTDFHGYTGELP
ncbi:MAG TPA: hypothetical protein VMQ10_15080, partial [Spirochaetia bacterium]|nr:hypothetical protein [Spirochaetia bacterium]